MKGKVSKIALTVSIDFGSDPLKKQIMLVSKCHLAIKHPLPSLLSSESILNLEDPRPTLEQNGSIKTNHLWPFISVTLLLTVTRPLLCSTNNTATHNLLSAGSVHSVEMIMLRHMS